jgi:hypothetical protein
MREADRRFFFDRHCARYAGDDSEALRIYARLAAGLIYQSGDKHVEKLSLISRAYNANIFASPREFAPHRDRQNAASIELGTEIAANAQAYPVFLVAWAEKSLKNRLASRVNKVGKVAAIEGWAAGK